MLAKQILTLLLLPAIVTTGSAQFKDLPIYDNGLIYGPQVMARLKHTVDSLNLKFKQYPLTTTYYSFKQAVGHDILLDTGDIRAALRDIQNGISYKAFIKKYPLAKIDSNTLILETTGTNYLNNETYIYTNIFQSNGDEFWITAHCVGITESVYRGLRGKIGPWIFDYSEQFPGVSSPYFRENIRAIYLDTPAAARMIPESYARNILYVDCMIDTASTVFLEGAIAGRSFFLSPEEGGEPRKNSQQYDRFMKYLEQQTKGPVQRFRLAAEKMPHWPDIDSFKRAYIADSLSTLPAFRFLLADAISEALKEKYFTDEIFEHYTAQYYSKDAALLMKRNRIVVGRCSRDPSPRLHIMDIGQLAAEAANWQVFLRAHLDIMNDYASRMFNSSYAEKSRNTYIREIEELDIDVQDLLLGITLRISNGAANHYFGSADRLGRAFAETRYRTSLEKKVLAMIADEQLDDYNRYLLQHLFLNYLYYLPEKTDRTNGFQLLEAAAKTTPAYLQQKLKLQEIKEYIVAGADVSTP